MLGLVVSIVCLVRHVWNGGYFVFFFLMDIETRQSISFVRSSQNMQPRLIACSIHAAAAVSVPLLGASSVS